MFWVLPKFFVFLRRVKSWRTTLNANSSARGLISEARQDLGAGFHTAKLLMRVNGLKMADEIWDISKDAPTQTNKGSAYAAYARALTKFDCSLDAGEILNEARQAGVPQAEMKEAMNRFCCPDEDDRERR